MSEMTPEIAQLNDLYAYYLNARCRVVEQMPTKVSALLATTMGVVDECERAPVMSRSAFKARIDQLLAAEPAEPVVVTQHVHFNLKDGDTDAIVAAFNRVTKPAKADESRWQTFVDAAIGLGLRAYVDSATGGVKVVSPSAYYLDKEAKTTRVHAAETAAAVEHFKGSHDAGATEVAKRDRWWQQVWTHIVPQTIPAQGESLLGRRFKLVELDGGGQPLT